MEVRSQASLWWNANSDLLTVHAEYVIIHSLITEIVNVTWKKAITCVCHSPFVFHLFFFFSDVSSAVFIVCLASYFIRFYLSYCKVEVSSEIINAIWSLVYLNDHMLLSMYIKRVFGNTRRSADENVRVRKHKPL